MWAFWVFLGEFGDSRIQTSGFESRIHECTSKRFESHESNGKLNGHRKGQNADDLQNEMLLFCLNLFII